MAYSGTAPDAPIVSSPHSPHTFRGETIHDNDFYISDDSDGAEGAEHHSIFDMEITGINPELMRIFNLTPPLNDAATAAAHASTVVPYYIVIYEPVPEGHKSMRISEGSVLYPELYGRVVAETQQILDTYIKRVGAAAAYRHKSFDDFFANYFVKKYTHREPFVFHYFFNGEWRTFNYSPKIKREIFAKSFAPAAAL